MKTKICAKCGEEKPETVEYFYRQKGCSGGLHSQCKLCIKAYKSRWYKENTEKSNKKSKKWSKENPEKVSEWNKRWREDNTEKCIEAQKKWRENNKEKINEYQRKCIKKTLKKQKKKQ